MTEQELLDATIQHFIVEGKPFGVEDGGCSYHKGCAIGIHLVKAEQYDDEMDNGGLFAHEVATIFEPQWRATFGELNTNFAQDVQTAHDETAMAGGDLEMFFKRLASLAQEYGLVMPTLDEVWLKKRLYANQAVTQQLS